MVLIIEVETLGIPNTVMVNGKVTDKRAEVETIDIVEVVEVAGEVEIVKAVEIAGEVERVEAAEIAGEVETVEAAEIAGEVEIVEDVEIAGRVEIAGAADKVVAGEIEYFNDVVGDEVVDAIVSEDVATFNDENLPR